MLFLMGLPAALLMVGDYQDRRGAVKGDRRKLWREGVLMCVDHVLRKLDAWVNVGRSVSKTEEQVSRLFENVTETRGFYSAGFLSGSGSSTEPVVLTRATHNGVNHGERRVSVKGILFSQHAIYSGEREDAERYVRLE